jgi:hypothetical protein
MIASKLACRAKGAAARPIANSEAVARPDGGVADSRDEAKAAFRAAVGRRPSTVRPAESRSALSWEKADVISSP